MRDPLRIYIGHDRREQAAYNVAATSAQRYGCAVYPLYESRLRHAGLLTRPVDYRGQMWDLYSNAPQSTDFAVARFWTPILAHTGWCLFVDCDVLFLEDPHELLSYADRTKAVQVVQHPPMQTSGLKMDGQVQTSYNRKLWSSVMLWNVDHSANTRLTLDVLNNRPGRDLHGFCWLADSEIGELPPEANWLVGLQAKPERPIIAHYTLGTPNMAGLGDSEHAGLWFEHASGL